MVSNQIFTIKPNLSFSKKKKKKTNLYNFNYVHHKAQNINITLLSTIKAKPNPLFV